MDGFNFLYYKLFIDLQFNTAIYTLGRLVHVTDTQLNCATTALEYCGANHVILKRES